MSSKRKVVEELAETRRQLRVAQLEVKIIDLSWRNCSIQLFNLIYLLLLKVAQVRAESKQVLMRSSFTALFNLFTFTFSCLQRFDSAQTALAVLVKIIFMSLETQQNY